MATLAAAVALVLLIDVSSSVTPEDYIVQRDGTAAAFRSDRVVNAVTSSCASIVVVEWSNTPKIQVPWTTICSKADAMELADRIQGLQRANDVGMFTCMKPAINMGFALLSESDALRKVIDVSGDGTDNCFSEKGEVSQLRDFAVVSEIVINGLSIGTDTTHDWYNENVVTHTFGGFHLRVKDWSTFQEAIEDKIAMEIM